MNVEGWQKDGTYVPCSDCGYTHPPHIGPGIPVRLAGVTHLSGCVRVPRLSPEARRRLQEGLDDIARCRRHAMAHAHEYVIG